MIVCSCNVLSHTQILATLEADNAGHPCSPARIYRCLGCAPQCGRCVATVRALLAEAHIANCEVGCRICPGRETLCVDEAEEKTDGFLIAAE